MKMPTDKTEIEEKLETAIHKLFAQDAFLLEHGANERAVSHKLAEYLQELFSEYNVDCEYNRHGFKIKTLDEISECRNKKTELVLPDILVHKRGNDSDNLIVIEINTSNKDNSCDLRKLELFTSQEGTYKYTIGFFIKFDKLNTPEIKTFENGREQ